MLVIYLAEISAGGAWIFYQEFFLEAAAASGNTNI